MSDTDSIETVKMDDLDDRNCIGNVTAFKETDPENVDAIKKYIEEQEILLRNSSPTNDLESIPDNQKTVGDTKVENELLKNQLSSDDSDMPETNSEKQKVFTDKELKSEEEKEELSKEENFVDKAGTELLEQHQDVETQEPQLPGSQWQANVEHQEVSPQSKHEDLVSTIQNNQMECDSKHNESKSPQEIKNQVLDCALTNQSKMNKFESTDSTDKSKMLKTAVAPEFETNTEVSGSEVTERPKLLHQLLTSDTMNKKKQNLHEFKCGNVKLDEENSAETLAIATSVMDMILTDTEAAINKKKVCNVLAKQCSSTDKANPSVPLAIGSKVEAKDFSELWYPAQIIELDCDEMEVLVQYDDEPKKHNEWISISSPRLRPINVAATKPVLPTCPEVHPAECTPEPKAEDKQKVTFAVGERCLARWRDNRRFIATVHNDLGNGHYEVMFDDGFQWKCTLTRLYKLKETSKHDYPSFQSSLSPSPAPSPAEPAAAPAEGLARVPLYHTHLFDPTRDYLGPKSERREMKRKLNIKEIFNIGQKRKKLATVDNVSKNPRICNNSRAEVKSETIQKALSPEATVLSNKSAREKKTVGEINNPVTKRPTVRKKPFIRKKIKLKIKTENETPFLNDVKKEIPDAVAAIIGTVCKSEPGVDELKTEPNAMETKDSNANDIKLEEVPPGDQAMALDVSQTLDKHDTDLAEEREIKVEKFEIQDAGEHEEVIDKIKEVITKLEDGINEVEKNEVKPPVETLKAVAVDDAQPTSIPNVHKEKRKKSKVKKSKKLRLMQTKKEKKHVDRVKCQLEEMKKQVEAMRRQIMLKTEELANSRRGEGREADEACLLPGEWCCRWVDGQPAGTVSEVEHDARPDAPSAKQPLPRRSVQVEDNRLPPGWTKHMVRRSVGTSAGKWDIVLVSPDNRRIHTKNDMRVYLENNPSEGLRGYEAVLLDFGIHLKLSRRLGWVRSSADGAPPPPPPEPVLSHTSPLVKRKKLALNMKDTKIHRKRPRELKIKIPRLIMKSPAANVGAAQNARESDVCPEPFVEEEATLDGASITDGFVHVGSLKVQVIETLLRCPAEGCLKNFRNTMLLKMHIKHYHRELRKMMGATPQVLDLAYARTRPTEAEMKRLKCEAQQRIIKVKLPRLHKRTEEQNPEPVKEVKIEPSPVLPPSTPPLPEDTVPKPQDSPKLRNALVNKPAKRPKVLLPVRNPEPEPVVSDPPSDTCNNLIPVIKQETMENEPLLEPKQEIPDCGVLDFETAISTHTVTRVVNGGRRERRPKKFATIAKEPGSEEEWPPSEDESRSSSCSRDFKVELDADADADADNDLLLPPLSSPSHDPASNAYMFTENGERIKLVRMKREEIINCHCGFREEDGLMVQCELCLCWQHALCHNIQREAEVPEKYTCSICLNPRRGRRRQRFTHDQDRLYEGLLPAGTEGRPSEPLRRAHELAANLLLVADALHAVRVNTHVATKKNHPKLYLWAKDWESLELSFAQEKLNSEYSDLNVIINNLGKENLPIKSEDIKEMALDIKTSPEEREERNAQQQKDIGSPALLSGLLSSPGGVSLDMPLNVPELDKLAKSVQERTAPQPEAAIENSACRARLLRHVQRCHALLDQRLDSIEAQVAELESQDPSLEEDETADFCPRSKQTVVMMGRDLDVMEELGILT